MVEKIARQFRNVTISVNEVLFLCGLACLFGGLWLLGGLGVALTGAGGVLVFTALISAYVEAQHVI